MSRVEKTEIRCLHCDEWFASPIGFGNNKTFDASTLKGNKAQCHHCGKMTDCNKENIRAHYEDGGFVGKDT